MGILHYHLVAITDKNKEHEIKDLIETQGVKPWFEYKGDNNVKLIYDNTQDLEYWKLVWIVENFEYTWWKEIETYFENNGPLVRIDKNLKENINKITTYGNRKEAIGSTTINTIYEWIINNYGNYCYHYVHTC